MQNITDMVDEMDVTELNEYDYVIMHNVKTHISKKLKLKSLIDYVTERTISLHKNGGFVDD